MHEHDHEIIMALAEGTLDDAATAAAEAAILACTECSADLELQRLAVAILDEAPEVYLTATESARLHDSLKRELVGSTTPPVRTQSRFAWPRWAPVAGIAAVFLVAVVSLPALFGGGSSDDASDETMAAPAMESAETRAATETTAAASQDMMNDGAQEMAGGADDALTLEAPAAITDSATTTEAMSETTTSVDLSYLEGLTFIGNLEDLDRNALLEMVVSDADELGEQSIAAKSLDPILAACLLTNTSPEVAPSLGVPIESETLLLGVVVTPVDEELILVAYVPDDVAQTVFVTQQAYFCEVVEILP